MRSPLERVEEEAVRNVVADGWGLEISELCYFPEGGGAYHWILVAGDTRRWFVTCDDLDTKPWLGSERDLVFESLLAAYGTATDLRAAGLTFVAAPVVSVSGAVAERVDDRHSVSVFEYIDGAPGQWGQPLPSPLHRELVALIALVHQATPATRCPSGRGLEVPGRRDLEHALDDLPRPWDSGPLSEEARRVLSSQVDEIVRSLTNLDRLALHLDDTSADSVVTHGEPHPGNLIRTSAGVIIVDWDTVALARPERDLWMLVDVSGPLHSVYRELTSITLDPDALAAYRLLWALSDLAAFTVLLRNEHRRGADTESALAGLRSILSGREPAPYGVPNRRGTPPL